jgi:hypothetical protein
MVLDLQHLNNFVTHTDRPEALRDILVCLFREVAMRWTNRWDEETGFERATEEELHAAFYCTTNELLIRLGQPQTQLGNKVVHTQ